MRVHAWMSVVCAFPLLAGAGGCSGESGGKHHHGATGGDEVEVHEKPPREELAEVLSEQALHIRDCGLGGGETVKIDITFEGASGMPIAIEYPSDSDLGRSVRVCIESNLTQARLMPFTQERFKVSYPFKLRDASQQGDIAPGRKNAEDEEAPATE